MSKVTLAWLFAIATPLALAQVGGYPDTSATGSASEMIGKVTQAQNALNQVDRDIQSARGQLSGLRPMQLELEEISRRLKARSDHLKDDFNQRIQVHNNQCTSRSLVRNSAEHQACQAQESQLLNLKRTIEQEMDGLIAQHNEVMAKYQHNKNQEVLLQASIQRLENWKSQVEPGIRRLQDSIRTQCQGLIANLEQLKHQCGNIQFDGARTDLPPCTTDACLRDRITR